MTRWITCILFVTLTLSACGYANDIRTMPGRLTEAEQKLINTQQALAELERGVLENDQRLLSDLRRMQTEMIAANDTHTERYRILEAKIQILEEKLKSIRISGTQNLAVIDYTKNDYCNLSMIV